MSQYSMEDIRELLRVHPAPLGGIKESDHEWWLGTLSISKLYPMFRTGYAHDLEQDSHFRKQRFEFDSRAGLAVIFVAFDPLSSNPQPPEYLVGWVPLQRERDVDNWIIFLNGEIRARLHVSAASGKRTLRRVGNFYELGYDDIPNAPKLSEARGKRALEHKADVVHYLKSGKTLIFSPGIGRDIFDEAKSTDTYSIVTDGTYAWQKQLAYYVDRYDIELPDDFEAHMRSNDWKLPDRIDIGALVVEPADQSAR